MLVISFNPHKNHWSGHYFIILCPCFTEEKNYLKEWYSLAKVAEVMKLNSEQEVTAQHSDVRALLSHCAIASRRGENDTCVSRMYKCLVLSAENRQLLAISVTYLMFPAFSSSQWDASPPVGSLTAQLLTPDGAGPHGRCRTPWRPLPRGHLTGGSCGEASSGAAGSSVAVSYCWWPSW